MTGISATTTLSGYIKKMSILVYVSMQSLKQSNRTVHISQIMIIYKRKQVTTAAEHKTRNKNDLNIL